MAKTSYKCKSHCERLMDRAARKIADTCPLPTTYEETITTTNLENGVKSVKSERVKRNIADRDKALKYWDFSLEALQLSGQLNNAQFMQLEQGSMAAADALDTIPMGNNEINNG